MGPGIIIPVLLIVVVIPVGFVWAKNNLKDDAGGASGEPVVPPSALLTSNSLRELPTPPWRVVYEISDNKLGGVEHVLIGPPGVFPLRTLMDPLPGPAGGEPDAHLVAEAAIARGGLDDALGRCAMSSDRLVDVYWGARDDEDGEPAVERFTGVTAVDGRRLGEWAVSLPDALTPAQVDLAWQTVVTAIGRPDPLA